MEIIACIQGWSSRHAR